MPIMDGYVATLKIRELIERNIVRDLFIAAYTADVTDNNIKKCEEYQFDSFIKKPCRMEKILPMLKALLG